jgi:hypothetical protein
MIDGAARARGVEVGEFWCGMVCFMMLMIPPGA